MNSMPSSEKPEDWIKTRDGGISFLRGFAGIEASLAQAAVDMLFWERSVGKANWSRHIDRQGFIFISWYTSSITIFGQNGVITDVT
jgi:hypothetical protein